MKYKAIIFDVDGTLIPNKEDGIVSKKVSAAIKKVNKTIHVGVATSRDRQGISEIISHLSLSGPSIIYGGSWIIDTQTDNILWQKNIIRKDFDEAYAIAKQLGFYFVINDNGRKYKPGETYTPQEPINIWGHGLEKNQIEAFLKQTSHLSSLAVHSIPSWKKGKIDFIANHAEATKQYAVFELARLLNISTHEIIGVGDGKNDLPLLMACGLKVAMGNADEDLKAIADYTAPSVDEDGVVDILSKYLL